MVSWVIRVLLLIFAAAGAVSAQDTAPEWRAVFFKTITDNGWEVESASVIVVDESLTVQEIPLPAAIIPPGAFLAIDGAIVSDDLRYVLMKMGDPTTREYYLNLVELPGGQCCTVIVLDDPDLESIEIGDFSPDGRHVTVSISGKQDAQTAYSSILTLEIATGSIINETRLDVLPQFAALHTRDNEASTVRVILGDWTEAGQQFDIHCQYCPTGYAYDIAWSLMDPLTGAVETPQPPTYDLFNRSWQVPLVSRLTNGETLAQSFLNVYNHGGADVSKAEPRQVRYFVGDVPLRYLEYAPDDIVVLDQPERTRPRVTLSNMSWVADGAYWATINAVRTLTLYTRDGQAIPVDGVFRYEVLVGTPSGWLAMDDQVLRHYTFDAARNTVNSTDVLTFDSSSIRSGFPSVNVWVIDAGMLGDPQAEPVALVGITVEDSLAQYVAMLPPTSTPRPAEPTAPPSPTPTDIPTLSPPATATTAPTLSPECAAGLPPRLVIGQVARVLGTTPNRLRDAPSISGQQIGLIEGGVIFDVLEGPVCADGITWWRVRRGTFVGWTAESDGTSYFVEPLLPPAPESSPTPTGQTSLSPTGCVLLSGYAVEDDLTIRYYRYDFATDTLSPQLNPLPNRLAVISPDGATTLFQFPTDPGSSPNMNDTSVYLTDNQTGARRILSGLRDTLIPQANGLSRDWVWSPDSQYVSAVVIRDSGQFLVVLSRAGEVIMDLSLEAVIDSYYRVRWSADSQTVVIQFVDGTGREVIGAIGYSIREGFSLAEAPDVVEPSSPIASLLILTADSEPVRVGDAAAALIGNQTPGAYQLELQRGGRAIVLEDIAINDIPGRFGFPIPATAVLAVSPDENHFVVFNPYQAWLISLTDAPQTVKLDGVRYPLVWSDDGGRFIVPYQLDDAHGFMVYDAARRGVVTFHEVDIDPDQSMGAVPRPCGLFELPLQ